MAITLDGTTGITAPGVTDTGNLSVAGTSAFTGSVGNITAGTISSGAITSSGLVTGATGALYPIVNGTAQASTSGTSIDFTSIPSWVKRITVMFNGVSTSGTSPIQVQLGSTTVTTTGYLSSANSFATAPTITGANSTTGLILVGTTSATSLWYGAATVFNISGNNWVSSSILGRSDTTVSANGGGSIALSGVLDRIRITTVNGTDTFDAGTINIQYE